MPDGLKIFAILKETLSSPMEFNNCYRDLTNSEILTKISEILCFHTCAVEHWL